MFDRVLNTPLLWISHLLNLYLDLKKEVQKEGRKKDSNIGLKFLIYYKIFHIINHFSSATVSDDFHHKPKLNKQAWLQGTPANNPQTHQLPKHIQLV